MKKYTGEEMELTDHIQLALNTSDEEVHRIRKAIIHLSRIMGANFQIISLEIKLLKTGAPEIFWGTRK